MSHTVWIILKLRFGPSGAVSPINDIAAFELHPNANKVTINRHRNKNDP